MHLAVSIFVRPFAFVIASAAALASALLLVDAPTRAAAPPARLVAAQQEIIAPELEGGVAWFNTGKPITLKELRGKIVMLDFWTYCCINCMHIIPDLTKLEEKYKNELVVIGVHSGKFENEKKNENIRKAILRYEIKHPVVNDADMKIWKSYRVDWWPTIAIIDPHGRIVAGVAGEVGFDLKAIDKTIASLVAKHRKDKTLDETPIRFDTAKFRDKDDTPLYFPGKVVVDAKGKRLLIADSTHHRIVVTDMNGKKLAIAGTGQPGYKDGPFDKAQFDDPQGMAIQDDLIFLADRKNNVLRTLDLKTKMVRTIPGTTKFVLRTLEATPWDVWLEGQKLFVAMAGAHQIWTYDLRTKVFTSFAGDATEDIKDGPLRTSKFAQPSGLVSDGRFLYVADSEVSAIRRIPLSGIGQVDTLVGRGLFIFGDRDGPGQIADPMQRNNEALLQHAVGITHHDGILYIADTYNSKIRTLDLATGVVGTFLGGPAKPGEERLFNEPTGITYHDGKLYVADTNAHRIRVVDVKTKDVSTLELTDVLPVEPPKTIPKK
jgi:thiol-disulfide isomerase/thioredoxin/outer membrane protein assembly factor BamB